MEVRVNNIEKQIVKKCVDEGTIETEISLERKTQTPREEVVTGKELTEVGENLREMTKELAKIKNRKKELLSQIPNHLNIKTKQTTYMEGIKLKITQIIGDSCKLTAFSNNEIIKFLENCFGCRSIAQVNHSNKGIVICTPNITPAIEELIKEISLSNEGVERALMHNITVKIESVKSTMKIMIKGFNPKQDN